MGDERDLKVPVVGLTMALHAGHVERDTTDVAPLTTLNEGGIRGSNIDVMW